MANNDIIYNDQTPVTPQSFTPESIDAGTQVGPGDSVVRKVRRTSVGVLKGSFVDFGSTDDIAVGGDTWTTVGLSFLRKISGLWRDVAKDGTDASGVTVPVGAVGIRGWMSALYGSFGTLTGARASSSADTSSTLLQQIRYSNYLSEQAIASTTPTPVTPAANTTWVTRSSQAGTSTLANKAGSATSATFLAANTNRLRYSVVNDSTAILYVLEGPGTASATNYTYQLPATGQYFTSDWVGAVNGVWASATGNARVTELTA